MAENSSYPETTDSIVVEQNGVIFETLVPEPVLLIPENKPEAETRVEFGIRMTNKTQKPMRFCSYRTLRPALIGSNGKDLRYEGGSNRSRLIRESDCPLVESGESVTFFLDGKLAWENNKLQLRGYYEFGGIWLFNDIKPGMYGFCFRYGISQESRGIRRLEKKILENIWIGQLETPITKISLVGTRD